MSRIINKYYVYRFMPEAILVNILCKCFHTLKNKVVIQQIFIIKFIKLSLLLCNYSKMFWIMHSVVFFKKNLTGSILHIKIIKQKFMWWEYITAASVLTLGWVKVRIAQEGYDRGRIGTPLGVKKEKKYYPLIIFVEKLRKLMFQWSVIRKVKAPLSFFLIQHNSVYHGLKNNRLFYLNTETPATNQMRP